MPKDVLGDVCNVAVELPVTASKVLDGIFVRLCFNDCPYEDLNNK